MVVIVVGKAGIPTSDGCSLCCYRSTSVRSLLLHLLVALVQIEDFDEGIGVYLVYSIPRGPTCLVVQEVALDKDTVLTHAPDPHISIILLLENNSCEGSDMTLVYI